MDKDCKHPNAKGVMTFIGAGGKKMIRKSCPDCEAFWDEELK